MIPPQTDELPVAPFCTNERGPKRRLRVEALDLGPQLGRLEDCESCFYCRFLLGQTNGSKDLLEGKGR